MLGIPALDVAIGLSFIYLTMALICTALTEMIAGALNKRAKFLEEGVVKLLRGPVPLAERLAEHPLIRSLVRDARQKFPSYIPSDRFATALMDLLSGPHPHNSIIAITSAVSALPEGDVKTQLRILVEAADGNVERLKKEIEDWFNSAMDRVSGWYKRNAHLYTIVIAVGITLFLNADSLKIARTLWVNPTIRQVVVDHASARAAKNPTDRDVLTDDERKVVGQLTGWTEELAAWRAKTLKDWLGFAVLAHLIGWIMTAVAVSQGAPFWFDWLNRFVNIRNSGRSPDEKPKT